MHNHQVPLQVRQSLFVRSTTGIACLHVASRCSRKWLSTCQEHSRCLHCQTRPGTEQRTSSAQKGPRLTALTVCCSCISDAVLMVRGLESSQYSRTILRRRAGKPCHSLNIIVRGYLITTPRPHSPMHIRSNNIRVSMIPSCTTSHNRTPLPTTLL